MSERGLFGSAQGGYVGPVVSIELVRSATRAFPHTEPPDAAVVEAGGRMVLLSGVQSVDSNDQVVGEGDFAAQTRGALRTIGVILADLGGSLSDIARTVIYVRSSADAHLDVVWNAYVEAMGERQPAATLVGVTLLGGGPARLVEIEATAVLPATNG
jgi:enamine deaminase RidA (YjgF/YER057c/UK114 family)